VEVLDLSVSWSEELVTNAMKVLAEQIASDEMESDL
jgi:hypothetical protein